MASLTRYVNTASSAGGDGTTNNTSGATRAYATLLEAVNAMPAGSATDQYTIYCSGSTADTSAIDQTPWDQVTSATNYIHIIGEQSPNHPSSTPTGVYDTGLYRIEVTNTNAVYNNLPAHLRIEGLQIKLTVNNAGSYVALKTANSNVTDAAVDYRVGYCIVQAVQTSGSVIGFQARPLTGGGGTAKFYNCLSIDCSTGFDGEFGTTEVYNCTAVDGGAGFVSQVDNGMKCINCLASNNTSPQDFLDAGIFHVDSRNNAASDATTPGGFRRINQTFTFTNSAGNDFTITSGDAGAQGFGYYDPSSGVYSDDKLGTTRTEPWDIGFSQVSDYLTEQVHYRWRADDGSESAATWLANEDTAISRVISTATRLRITTDTTVVEPPTQQLTLQYKKSTDSVWLNVPTTSPVAVTFDTTVSHGTDDAQQVGTTMTLTGTTIGASLDATTDWAGMRFRNVQVPAGATVTAAYVSVVPSGTGEDEPLVTVFLEAADNAATFSSSASDISNRSRTTGVSWDNANLGADGSTYFNSPSLVTDVQAVVDRGGWAYGNAMAVHIQGGSTATRDLTIESFENTANNPPKLHIEYTVPTAFQLKASANITASGENTTRQLSIPSGKASGDFDGGRIQDDENPGDTVDVTISGFREDEWCLEATATATEGAVYQFRLVKSDGSRFVTYTVTPQWTIAAAASAPQPSVNDAATVAESVTMHMPISLRMEKLS